MGNQYHQNSNSSKPDSGKTWSAEDARNSVSNASQAVDPGGVQTRFSPVQFLIITIGGIFLAEIIAMIVIYGLPHLPYYLQSLIDACIMVILIFPLIYYFSLRPLLLYIEKHQRLEDALRRSEERFALAYRSNPAALSITHVEDGRFIEINDSFLRQSGYARDEVINHTMDELGIYPNPEEREQLRWLLLKQRSVDGFEMTARRKSGEIRYVSVSTEAIEIGGEVNILAIASDITERKQAEARLWRVNQALTILKKCNQLQTRSENEIELLQKMCETIVNVGGYCMAWVGFAEQNQERSVRPIAQFGIEDGYLEHAQITWADNEHGRGPTGTAIREGVTQVNQNFQTNPKMEPWRASALSRGYQSSIALPLKDDGSIFGALTVYSTSPDAFDEEEVELMNELADDLAFGVTVLRVRAERNKAQEQVREMALFPTLNPDVVMRVDASGRIEKTNPAADQMGFYVGAQIKEILPDLLDLDLTACIATGDAQQVQVEARLGDHVLLLTVRGIPDLGLAFLYGKDITERKSAETAIHRLSRIVEQTEDTVAVTNRMGKVEYVNPAFERLTGFTKEEVLGKTPNILKSGLHDEQFYKGLWKTILDGKVFLGEIANRKKSGELFYEVKTITPLRDEQGNITHFVATGKDITERKLDEEKLREAYDELELRVEERTKELRMAISELENEIAERRKMEEALRISEMDLENAQEVARIGNWKWNLEKGEITWSDEMYRIFGIDKNSYTGRLGEVISNVIHPDDLHLVLPSNAQSFADKKPIEYRIVLSDKSIRHIWAKSGETIVDNEGKPIFLTGIAQDITERKRAEETLRESEEKYKKLVKYAPAAIYEMNLQGTKFLSVNEVMCDILMYSREELLSTSPMDLLDQESKSLFLERIRKKLAGENLSETVEYRIRRKDGEWIYTDVKVGAVTFTGEDPARVVVIGHDITERKRNEEKIQAANKELIRFNNAMVGRELRMIELKKEVNELCEIVGQPPRYPLDFEKEKL
jgi:PAS domain S-box-containing protein